MKKIETIWHHLLHLALSRGIFKHTQQEIARTFNYSLSTINHALSNPMQIGAVRKETKFFILEDAKKLLYYWASLRALTKDIIYTTHVAQPVQEIEGLMIPEAIFAGYSAARRIFKEAPADYSTVYVYVLPQDLATIKERFPSATQLESNLVVLKMHPVQKRYGGLTTLPQTFVDIWNLKDWYAREFILKLEEKIDGLLS